MNNEENVVVTEPEQEEKKGKKKWLLLLLLLLLLFLIFIFIFLFKFGIIGCGNTSQTIETIGDVTISTEKEERPVKPKEEIDDRTITFAGTGVCEVSKDYPKVEVHNPEINFVVMMFTLTDEATGEVIAKTGEVPAGSYAYIDVVKFYKEPGTYKVLVHTDTKDPETNEPMNGMDQVMEVIVK